MANVKTPPTPRRRTPRAEVRARVLDAAATVFAEQGFAVASIDEIATAAGFTKGAVYSNFSSKDELFFALMDREIAARFELAERLFRQLSTARELTHDVGRHLTEAMGVHRDWQLLFIEYWQRAMRDPGTRERFVAHRRELRRLVTEMIQEMLDTGRFPTTATASSLTFILLGLTNGMAIEELLDPGAVPPNLMGEMISAYLTHPAGETATS